MKTRQIPPLDETRDKKTLYFLDQSQVTMIDEAYWGFGSIENDYVKPFIDEYPNLVICR